MKLRTGILLIGSLQWDTNKVREIWRAKQFASDDGIFVKVPICYGRKSEKRQIYTMIFSPSLPATSFGTALVRRCKGTITSFDDLFREAAELWKAESLKSKSPAKGEPLLSAYWGCVSLKPHPRFLMQGSGMTQQERELRQELLQKWATTFRQEWERRKTLERKPRHARREGESPSAVYAFSEMLKAAVNDEGLLQIDWPTLPRGTAELEGFDLLLATVTTPLPKLSEAGYHGPSIIANALKANSAEATYFTLNERHGITTFQDEQIKNLLSQH